LAVIVCLKFHVVQFYISGDFTTSKAFSVCVFATYMFFGTKDLMIKYHSNEGVVNEIIKVKDTLIRW
jgi:hypothetical protein